MKNKTHITDNIRYTYTFFSDELVLKKISLTEKYVFSYNLTRDYNSFSNP